MRSLFCVGRILINFLFSLCCHNLVAGRLPKSAGFLAYHEQFDNDLFNFSDGLANFMDPQQRLLHETTYEALFDAGLDPFNVGGKRAGCFVGSCYNDTNYARVSEQATKNEKYYGRNCQFVCDTFNLKGVSLTVDTACAASFSALHQAIQAFDAGEVDFAVIGALSVQLRVSCCLFFLLLPLNFAFLFIYLFQLNLASSNNRFYQSAYVESRR